MLTSLLQLSLVLSTTKYIDGFISPIVSARKQPLTISNNAATDDYNENVMNTYGRYPMTVSHGKGCNIYDINGKEYLDCAAGIATCCLGHSHPALKAAVCEQMDRLHHCSNLYFIPEQGKLAKWLVSNSCADKVW